MFYLKSTSKSNFYQNKEGCNTENKKLSSNARTLSVCQKTHKKISVRIKLSAVTLVAAVLYTISFLSFLEHIFDHLYIKILLLTTACKVSPLYIGYVMGG